MIATDLSAILDVLEAHGLLDRLARVEEGEKGLHVGLYPSPPPSMSPAKSETIEQFEKNVARALRQKEAEERTRNGNRARWVEPTKAGDPAVVPARVKAKIREERERVRASSKGDAE